MNNFARLLLIATFTLISQISCGSLVETIKKTTDPKNASAELFVDILQAKKNQLEKHQQERTTRLATHDDFSKQLQESIEEVSNVIESVEHEIDHKSESAFLNQQLILYKEMYQVLKDLQRVDEDFLALLDSIIEVLTQFVEDPEFSDFKKQRQLEARPYYSFEDLHLLYDVIVTQERLVAQLAEQEKNMQSEQESRKRFAKTADEDHTKRLEDLQSFAERQLETYPSDMPAEQQEKELISLEERLYRNKKELYELRLLESKYAIDLIQMQLFIERAHQDLLKSHLRQVKSSIRVNEIDVLHAKELLSTQKKEYFARKQQYQLDRDRLTSQQKRQERARDTFAKNQSMSLGRDLDEWGREPKQTVSSYLSVAEFGALNSHVQWLQKERDLLETERTLEDEKFNYLSLQAGAKETYYKISSRKFSSEEEITHEIKQYEVQKTDAQSTLAIYKERMNAVADLLNQQKKIRDNINNWRERAQKQKESIFKNKLKDYTTLLEVLNQAEEYVKQRIDVLAKLTGVYSAIISEVSASLRLISFIIGELQSITIWYRPEYAITWNGIKNIGPDLVSFFSNIRAHIMRFDVSAFVARITERYKTLFDCLLLLIKCVILALLLFALQRTLPRIKNFLLAHVQKNNTASSYFMLWLAVLVIFIEYYFVGIALFAGVSFLFFILVHDPYLYALFYLMCIPILLFFTNRFMQFLELYNTQYDYALLTADFAQRFVVVISTLLYATISIFLLRQGFLRTSFYRSELPTILLAINFIIFQISLIFLISKEHIVSIIPSRNNVWLWIRAQVDHYFYLLLAFVIVIIVMSNPYVGFGRLVLYLLSSFLYTALLVKILLLMHGWVKQIASYTFFFSDEEMVRERFAHARTWFGLLIIGSFFVFTFLGLVIGAKIWGWPINIKEMSVLFTRPLLLETTAHPITMISLLQIIGFVLLGFVAAYALNRFVLDKIFDLLLVDPGVQYTTIRFIQYFVVVVFVFFGFKNVGLGDLIGYMLGALALGIGWYVREPIGDFIAYFIILVQRPLKIGDFVQIDADTIGVVRAITPRTIVIRRKNSTTIVVPNSYIINHSIVNWNYVRNFIAFNDILVTVPFSADPAQVKELLATAVASHQNVLRNPKPLIRLEEFGEYGYIFLVRGFISSAYTMDMWDIASDVRLAMVKLLRENNIEIAELIRIVKDPNAKMARLSPQQKEDMGKVKE